MIAGVRRSYVTRKRETSVLISQFVTEALYVLPQDPKVKEVTEELRRNNGVERDCDLNSIPPEKAQTIMNQAWAHAPHKRRAGSRR